MTTPPLDLTNTEWRTLQQIPEQGHSHRAWIDNRIRERVAQVTARAEAAEQANRDYAAERGDLLRRAEAAEKKVAKVRNIHRPAKFEDSDLRYCVYCDRDDRPAYYPCPTITALDTHTPETETTP